MALDVKLLTFTANTTSGDQDLTGTSFTPKAAILFGTPFNTAVDTFVDGAQTFFAFTDGTNHRVSCATSQDNASFSNTVRDFRNDSIVVQNSTSATQGAQATFVSFLSNGMRINWAAGDVPVSAFKFHVLFLGGSDLTNVNVGTITLNNATGNQSITTPGFQPDLVIFAGARNNVENELVLSSHGGFSIGAATSSSAQWTQGFAWEDGRNISDTWQYYNHSDCITCQVLDSGGITGAAQFVSMDTNGFTFNIVEAPGIDTIVYYYIALKGGSYAVGNDTEPASTGNQTITTNKDTNAVMIFGVDTSTAGTSSSTMQVESVFTIGAGTSSSEMACAVVEDVDNAGTTETVSRYETDSIYLNITANATAGSSTVDDEASLSSVSTTGFVLNWSNVGQTRPFRYITFGDTVVASEELFILSGYYASDK